MTFPIKKVLIYAALLAIPGGSIAVAGIEIYRRYRRRKEGKDDIKLSDKNDE